MTSVVSLPSALWFAALIASYSAGLMAQPPGDWTALFNGTDLKGWTIAPGPTPAKWRVEDGTLVGGDEGGRGSLVSDEQFRDFELELEFMLAEHGTECSADVIGPEQTNASADKTCLYNSGVTFRTGYQVNIGRREAGEFIGIVVHRKAPGAIRGNVLWLDRGDQKFPGLRKKDAWNRLVITAKGTHITVDLNSMRICDVVDDPTDPSEAMWKEAGPIGLQWPALSESAGFAGYVKFRNVRIRRL